MQEAYPYEQLHPSVFQVRDAHEHLAAGIEGSYEAQEAALMELLRACWADSAVFRGFCCQLLGVEDGEPVCIPLFLGKCSCAWVDDWSSLCLDVDDLMAFPARPGPPSGFGVLRVCTCITH